MAMVEKPGALMETHVSSTTADVPESQEVIGSHGDVELVIVVEKLDEEQSQKADSNSQPVAQDSKTPSNQSTKKDGLSQNSPPKQPLQETEKKQAESSKPVLPIIKIQHKQSIILSPNKSENRLQNRQPDSNNIVIVQSSPSKEPTSQAGVHSTPVKENNKLMTEQLGRENKEGDLTVNVEKESSNDSQVEMDCDASEKEHNKSISRELKSLINSAKESKIISECTKLTSKTRKSRAPLDTSNTSLNVTGDADSEQVRCNSDNSLEANSSAKSEKAAKRSMRSQNPEFVHKVKQFLSSVTGKFQKIADSDASSASDEEMVDKSKENIADNTPSTPTNSQPNLDQTASETEEKSNKLRSDPYCWRCHWTIDMTEEDKTTQPPLKCTVCPRSFHFRCLTGIERNKIPSENNWVCPGCLTVLHAESSESRSNAMKKTSVGALGELLKFALQRMTEINGVEPFMQPVDRAVFPDYDKYVVHPMDLALMKQHIAEGLYGSTEAFLGDAHWILHNSIIFNTLQSKLTTAARALVRCCRAEMGEIEACPECYAAANSRRPTWFTDVCSTPHLLLWAKLKGFPYWPSKAMSVSQAGLVDVRFFGAHDRAWVPARDCFLFSKKDPNNFRTKRQDILDSVLEAEQHIRVITRKYGKFVYAPYRVQFEPFKLQDQLKLMIPSFEGTVKSPVRDKRPKTPTFMKKSRTRSKGSKDGINLGDDGSDRETSPLDVEKLDEDSQSENNQFVATRKRRRSELKDAGTPDSCSKEKNRRIDANCKEQKLKRNSSQLLSGSKEKADHADAAEPADDAPAACTPGATPKPNKNTPKTIAEKRKRSASALQNKSPTRMMNNDKDKMISQEPKAGKQNAKNTRSKSLNRELIKIEPNNADTSTNKINAATENNTPSKTSDATNKSQLEADKPSEKATEPVAATPSATNKTNVTESSTITRSNAKEKLNESSSSIIAIDNQNEKPNNNSENENKNDETTDATQKKAKEKSVEPVTPNKGNTKDKAINAVLSETTGKEKTNETDPSNDKKSTKENITDHLTSGNIVEVTKKRASTGSKEVIVISKVVDNNAGNKKIPGTVTIIPEPSTSKTKFSKDKIFKDDSPRVSLVTRKVTKVGSPGGSGLPTISCVRSLSAAPAATSTATTSAATTSGAATAGTAAPTVTTVTATTASPTASTSSTAPITVEVDRDSSIFTPTSTDQVHNMKDALNKLQKLKTGVEPPQVGRVGVKAFARISPPENNASGVVVEIKAEPMDFDEAEAEPTISELATTSPARPRGGAAGATLREVRISKVVAGPVAKKTVRGPDVRPRAKKTFPQPKKADDGRSELTSKNSMVYIPIQGTARAAPRPAPPPPPPLPRSSPVLATAVNLMGPPPPPPPPPPPAPLPAVPSAVHTVPLISSVNGHWTFSLQPVMSVGAGDSTTPVVNGVLERVTPIPAVAVSPSMGTTTITAITPMLPPPPPPPPPPAPPAPLAPPAAPVPTATSAPTPPAPAAVSATFAPSAPAKTTTTLADVVLGEPPKLQQRPTLQSPLAAGTPVADLPAPSAAGPLTAKLNQNSVKLADFFRTLLEDSLEQLEEPEGQVAALRLQLEQARWKYEHEVTELRHTQELLLIELRSAMEKEKARAVGEARRLAQQELHAAVRAVKGKQWCANCFQEAQYYCCWNTAYCDYPCQRAHWAQHYASCTQQRTPEEGYDEQPGADSAPPLPADEAPKAAAPALTVGGKVRAAPDRGGAPKPRAAAD